MTTGQIREDTVNDYKLDTKADERIVFGKEQDCDAAETRSPRHRVLALHKRRRLRNRRPLDDLRAIWSAGETLADIDPIFRKIYTYSGNGTEANPNENFIKISEQFMALWSMHNFLGVNDDTEWAYLGKTSEIQRAVNLMQWTTVFPTLPGSITVPSRFAAAPWMTARLWKLGDIIHSTPTSVAQPLADYDLLYNDASYYDYYMKQRNRETAVYVGSNDGMLHAFTGWVYNNDSFVNPYDVPGYFTNTRTPIRQAMSISAQSCGPLFRKTSCRT